MRIYLAAPWADKAFMEVYAAPLEAADHTITHKWWLVEGMAEGDELATVAYHRKNAELDYQGVKDCQLLVLVNSAKSEGKSIEQGIALADRKPVIAIGKRGQHSQNVFHYMLNYIWVENIENVVDILRTIHWLLKAEGR